MSKHDDQRRATLERKIANCTSQKKPDLGLIAYLKKQLAAIKPSNKWSKSDD